MIKKKICVIGAGYWGKNHLKTLNSLNVLKGVVELDTVTLKSIINTYPKVKGHCSIEDAMLEDYDGFTIATPAKTHFEVAKKIIEAKKHVLIEKPMTFSIEEAEELVKLAINGNENKLRARRNFWVNLFLGLIP